VASSLGLALLGTHAPDPVALGAVCTHGNVRGAAVAKGGVRPSSSSSSVAPALVKWGLEAGGGHGWWGTGW